MAGDKSSSSAVPMFVVARNDKVRVFVDVPEAFAPYVNEGTAALVRADATSGLPITGKITRTSWSLHERTRTLRAEIDLPVEGLGGLRPGTYVHVTVIVDRHNVRALPQQALADSGMHSYCYLLRAGKAVKTPVLPGIPSGDWIEVVSMKIDGSWVKITGSEDVILGDLSEITDGETVQVEPPPPP